MPNYLTQVMVMLELDHPERPPIDSEQICSAGDHNWEDILSFALKLNVPLTVNCFLLFLQNSGIGYQYLTYILGLGINI